MKQYVKAILTDVGTVQHYDLRTYDYLKNKVSADGKSPMLQFVAYVVEQNGQTTEFDTLPTVAQIQAKQNELMNARKSAKCSTCGK